MAKQKSFTPDRVYPHDMHAILLPLWENAPFFPNWPKVELPAKPVLDLLLDVCYHASMMTEEGRPTVFRVLFLPSTASVSRQDGPVAPVTKYTFLQTFPFNEAELRRLAPVADPRRLLIAVENIGTSVQPRLQIYGLVDIGMALWEMARHERVSGYGSPEALIVSSSRPGELYLSRSDRPVARLRDGKIVSPTDSVLMGGPVRDFFANADEEFIRSACENVGVEQPSEEDHGLDLAHLRFVESILLYTAELKHGGTLLFVPDEMTHEDSRLVSRVNIKYVLPSTRPQDALVSAMSSRLRHNAAMDVLQERKTVRREELEALETLEEERDRYQDAARDAARFVASLTAVDGAVVLTDTFRIIGFGAEVTASFSGTDKVHIALDAEGTETREASFVGYGTRHRSAFRFTGSMESSVAFVMSQDGGIKAIRQVGAKLLMWQYFKIGFVKALT